MSRFVVRALVCGALVASVAAGSASAAQAPGAVVSNASLVGSMYSAATSLGSDVDQIACEAQLAGVIEQSGVEPEIVRASLLELRVQPGISRPCIAAIDSLLGSINGVKRRLRVGSTLGPGGFAPFASAPGFSGGGGGGDYVR